MSNNSERKFNNNKYSSGTSTNTYTNRTNNNKTTNNSGFNNQKSNYTRPYGSGSKPKQFDSNSNSSSYRERNNYSDRTKRYGLFDEMDNWVKTIRTDNFDEMVVFFQSKKPVWEEQIGELLKKLTREHKYEMIDYVLKNIQLSASNTNKHKLKIFTLLNENVWIGRNNSIDETYDESLEFDKIIKTFDVLISNGFNFIDFSHINNDPLNKAESFIGAVINEKNRMEPGLKDRLYNYFTKIFWDREHFVSCLRMMFNKITETNSKLFIDNMQFILSRDVDVMSYEIFKLIVSRESTSIVERNIINGLFSDLIGSNDLSMYFESINIGLIRETFLLNIIDNYSRWINDIIGMQKISNPDVDFEEFETNDYGVLMMIFGCAYSKGLKKDIILSHISNIIDRTNINLIKPFGVFLETSNISNVDLTEQEHQIISKFINKFYFDSSVKLREKYIVESILSNFASISKKSLIDVRKENIECFLTTGSFTTIKKVQSEKNKSVFTMKNNNTFCGLVSDSDDESDTPYEKSTSVNEFDEINEDFGEEYPEPDEKVLKNINMYFKSNDKDASFDDLKYFIETSKTNLNKFVCGLLYSLGERTLSDVIHIKNLIRQINLIRGFERVIVELDNFIKMNQSLVEMLKCDNPKLAEIICELN
jgi:hypothetical protein